MVTVYLGRRNSLYYLKTVYLINEMDSMVTVYLGCRNCLYYTRPVSDHRNGSVWSLYILVVETLCIILKLSN